MHPFPNGERRHYGTRGEKSKPRTFLFYFGSESVRATLGLRNCRNFHPRAHSYFFLLPRICDSLFSPKRHYFCMFPLSIWERNSLWRYIFALCIRLRGPRLIFCARSIWAFSFPRNRRSRWRAKNLHSEADSRKLEPRKIQGTRMNFWQLFPKNSIARSKMIQSCNVSHLSQTMPGYIFGHNLAFFFVSFSSKT